MAFPSVTSVTVENVTFPPTVKPPCSPNTFFLAGAGVRGLQIHHAFVKFTAICIYLQYDALSFLSVKWKTKSTHQLTESDQFFSDIVTGPFEKFMQVTMIKPLTGQQYSEKVAENCVAIWRSLGIYTDSEAEAIDKFLSVFKDLTFPPGSSILFTVSPNGSLTISFSGDETIPEVTSAVIENKLLSEAVLESMIGKNGVSPAAKQSLASRLSHLFKEPGVCDPQSHK
uniref:Chalcone--flavanone isomerase 2-A n=5 Tax=Glycine subgen. Soja TaxID=1462606 RepID=CFI2A_SOYBN|nr:RecName: Full=Chalcone--flavanone isomerase 2-A; Short=Chalcone isomerase 2-A [Glycine max]AAT94360.1 chalcone isomerase 2 [Glycine max]ACN81823.1 chalcone isomerase [Glycine max]